MKKLILLLLAAAVATTAAAQAQRDTLTFNTTIISPNAMSRSWCRSPGKTS